MAKKPVTFTFTAHRSAPYVHVTVRGGDDPKDLPVLGRLIMDADTWAEFQKQHFVSGEQTAA